MSLPDATQSMASQGHHSPPVDLRRVTSNSTLLTPSSREHKLSTHPSQHLQTATTRLGSRSPSSIPSSPTSAHSSSSAIFERDIEPFGSSSPPSHGHLQNPHRIPRSKTTEQLEQNVPSVLDTAAAILTSSLPNDEDYIAVVTPAYERGFRPGSGFASPIGSLRSRSPSPTGTGMRQSSIPGPRTSLLLSVPSPPSATPLAPLPFPIPNPSASPKEIPSQRLTIQTNTAALVPSYSHVSNQTRLSPSISTPTSVYYSTVEDSPMTTMIEHPPASAALHSQSLPTPASAGASTPHATTALSPASQCAGSPYTYPASLSHPPSPTPNQKHLSFISYTDLLASTPAATVPLSSLTNCSAADPPPHIPRVSGLTQCGIGGSDHKRWGDADSMTWPDDQGGEWAREGLGRGLEERLEALMTVPHRS